MSVRRKRGVILTQRGWERLQEAERRITESGLLEKAHTLQELSELTGLSQNTLTRVRGRKVAVDRGTLEHYLQAFGLTLEPQDYTDSVSAPVIHQPIPLIGQVPLNSAFYVYRSAVEAQIAEVVTYPGTFLQIRAPQQFGKTSLVARTLATARSQELTTALLSLRLVDSSMFSDAQRFGQWFCVAVAQALGLSHHLDKFWNPLMSWSYNCTYYFETYILSEIEGPLLLAIDDLDLLYRCPEVATQVFRLLRAWHEMANYGDSRSALWQKLRLIAVCSTDVYSHLNYQQSPFETGLTFQLSRFSETQIEDLAQRYGSDSPHEVARELMALVGGHPYLVQLALHQIYVQGLSLKQLIQNAVASDSVYASHLRNQLWNLQQYPELVDAMRCVVASSTPVRLDPIVALKLESKNLITLQHQQHAVLSCNLYHRYFAQVLAVKANSSNLAVA